MEALKTTKAYLERAYGGKPVYRDNAVFVEKVAPCAPALDLFAAAGYVEIPGDPEGEARGAARSWSVRAGRGCRRSPFWPVIPPPLLPPDLQVSKAATSATLSWDAVTQATGYRVLRSTQSGQQDPDDPVESYVTGTSFTDSGLDATVTYYYKVVAYNGNASGDKTSNEVEAPAGGPPPTPAPPTAGPPTVAPPTPAPVSYTHLTLPTKA